MFAQMITETDWFEGTENLPLLRVRFAVGALWRISSVKLSFRNCGSFDLTKLAFHLCFCASFCSCSRQALRQLLFLVLFGNGSGAAGLSLC